MARFPICSTSIMNTLFRLENRCELLLMRTSDSIIIKCCRKVLEHDHDDGLCLETTSFEVTMAITLTD